MISTGLKKLDTFLSGGIPNGVIIDIFGGNGTGKTQLVLQLSINSIKNGGNVLFLDTTGGFRPERILEIQKKSNLNINLLDKITVSRITNTSEQINSIKTLQEHNFSLIIIDNVTDLFSYEYKNNKIKTVKEFKLQHSLGACYGTFTESLGFKPDMDEGKTMGLAAYGKYSEKIQKKLEC